MHAHLSPLSSAPAPWLAPGGLKAPLSQTPQPEGSPQLLLFLHHLLALHTLPCAERWWIQRWLPFSREMYGEDLTWAPGSHPAAPSCRPIPQDASGTLFPSMSQSIRGSWVHALLLSHGHHTVHAASLPTQTPALASAGALSTSEPCACSVKPVGALLPLSLLWFPCFCSSSL